MDLEQLKLILATVEKAGDGALFVAVLHFGYPYFSAMMVVLGIVVALLVVRRLLGGIVQGFSMDPELKRWGEQLGTYTNSTRFSFSSDMTSKERVETIHAISRLIEANKKL